ncbi:hypothetical protein BC936DRAFT_139480 [Jimgerdemannia flammicorona]|uniref:FYVE-type domain-containing protein n=1 Tax=Jimgerdemannia flammicorona TaxID=994334 RepID=A0A433DMS8_9FUNG|nr:hypothetical protein BC936DRAFT_139480 [Jimgerdemannia flammicorona]
MASAVRPSQTQYDYADYVPADQALCPICELACVSLQQLNQHIDDAHTEEESKNILVSWFRNTQKRVLSNKSPLSAATGSSANTITKSFSSLVDQNLLSNFNNLTLSNVVGGTTLNSFTPEQERAMELVTNKHWQRETGQDICTHPGCGKALGSVLGKIGVGKQHCMKCGRLYCDAHCQLQMRLSTSAQHDPQNGIWCRACESCYGLREGYFDYDGARRDHSATFLGIRKKTIERVHLESNRLEKRLEKLARVYADATASSAPIVNPNAPVLMLPQSSSPKRSDSTSTMSSVLSTRPRPNPAATPSLLTLKKVRGGHNFTLTNRKHHCRLCGRVVCGEPRCSGPIPLFLNMATDATDEDPVGETRACRECRKAVFRRKIQYEELSRPLPVIGLYAQLAQLRRNIEKVLPQFQEMVVMLEQQGMSQQPHPDYVAAAKIRKELLDDFTSYDTISKRIFSLPTRSASLKRLHTNIHIAATHYLQKHMFPLQMLPKILKPLRSTLAEPVNGTGKSKNMGQKAAELQEVIKVLEEQCASVESYVAEAQKKRKFDDVKTLKASLDDLKEEIGRLKAEIREEL